MSEKVEPRRKQSLLYRLRPSSSAWEQRVDQRLQLITVDCDRSIVDRFRQRQPRAMRWSIDAV